MIAIDNTIPAQIAQKDVTCTQLLPSQFYFVPLQIRSAAVKTRTCTLADAISSKNSTIIRLNYEAV